MPKATTYDPHPYQPRIQIVRPAECCCGPGNYCPAHGTFEPAAGLETQDLIHEINHEKWLMMQHSERRRLNKPADFRGD